MFLFLKTDYFHIFLFLCISDLRISCVNLIHKGTYPLNLNLMNNEEVCQFPSFCSINPRFTLIGHTLWNIFMLCSIFIWTTSRSAALSPCPSRTPSLVLTLPNPEIIHYIFFSILTLFRFTLCRVFDHLTLCRLTLCYSDKNVKDNVTLFWLEKCLFLWIPHCFQ